VLLSLAQPDGATREPRRSGSTAGRRLQPPAPAPRACQPPRLTSPSPPLRPHSLSPSFVGPPGVKQRSLCGPGPFVTLRLIFSPDFCAIPSDGLAFFFLSYRNPFSHCYPSHLRFPVACLLRSSWLRWSMRMKTVATRVCPDRLFSPSSVR